MDTSTKQQTPKITLLAGNDLKNPSINNHKALTPDNAEYSFMNALFTILSMVVVGFTVKMYLTVSDHRDIMKEMNPDYELPSMKNFYVTLIGMPFIFVKFY